MKKILIGFMFVLVSSGLIFPGSIAVNKPNGTIPWFKGNTYQIIWTPSGCKETDYKINIYKDSISQENFKLQLTAKGVTQKSWTIPGTFEAGTYVIRVKAENTCQGDSREFEIKDKLQINPKVFKKLVKKPVFKPSKGLFKPVVKSILTIPLGALKPGVQLFVKGEKFGSQKGRILIKGNFPGGHIELENVTWVSDSKVNGFVPQSANGQPNQIVSVVVVSKFNFKSDPFGSPWFYGREEKVLTSDAVGVQCGSDGNCNTCNQTGSCDSQFVSGCSTQYAICGEHINNWGTVGDDSGADIYSINLQNGWVLKSIQTVKWHKSSGDEYLSGPTPSFPAGSANWSPVINWKVSPNDNVRYEFKIIVEGPIGTSYK
ncbi:MAG: hypothetical protein ABFR36_05140 [Acidobacteriota bacterium]